MQGKFILVIMKVMMMMMMMIIIIIIIIIMFIMTMRNHIPEESDLKIGLHLVKTTK
jgi:hypothetical protein